MLSTLLWIFWIGLFAVLELVGLSDSKDDKYTLTNRVRAVMRKHPVIRRVVRAAIAVGLAWLAHHFLVVDPELNPGAML